MTATYNVESLKVLDQMEGIRQKLPMYAGSTKNPNQIALELISNSIDEVAQGYGDSVIVEVNKDGSLVVEDHGRGIPFETHKETGMSGLDLVFMKLHAGGKIKSSEDGYKTSIGTHGVGCTIATATCDKMEVVVHRNCKRATRVYSRGKTVGDLIINKITDSSIVGTKITYWPDPTKGIWDSTEFDISAIKKSMRDFSYFFPNVKLVFHNNIGKKPEEIIYVSENGLSDMFSDMTSTDEMQLKEPIHIKTALDDISDGLEIIFGFTNGSMERVHSYCNALKLAEGGTHVQGFRTALTKALNDAGRNLDVIKAKDANLKGQEIFESIVSIISVKLKEPKFENQTKTKLSNPDLAGKVNSIVYEYLKNYFEDNPKVVITLIDRILRMRYAKEKARKAKELALSEGKKNEFSTTLIGKLSHCSGKDPMKNELIIIEGLSAGGNIKQARDSKTQAVYALKGKVLNVEKADITKIAENQEIRDLINILGTGIGDDFNISKLKYGKIIIATDADVDGSHISVLLLTFLFKFMPELIKHGHVYSAVGPLYKIMYNNQSHYAMDDKERNEIINKIKNKYKYSVTRYKGLIDWSSPEMP